MSDTPKDPAPSGDTQNNPPCHCPECGKTTTFEHPSSDRCADCGHFVGRGELPPLNTEKKYKGPILSEHAFLVSKDIMVRYRADCPVCKKQTQWNADMTCSWCVACGYFVRREIIKDVPVITPKDPTDPGAPGDTLRTSAAAGKHPWR